MVLSEQIFPKLPESSFGSVLSEQIFPKLPESSFGRESVRELMAFIADVVNLGCRARRAVDS